MNEPTSSGYPDQWLQSALEAAGIGIWEFNLQKGEITCNTIATQQLGIEADTKLDLDKYLKLIHPDDRKVFHAALMESWNLSVNKPFEATYRIVNPPAVPLRWVRSSGKMFFEKDKNPSRLIGTTIDVTRQKTTEEKLRESNNQFISLANSLPQIVWTAQPDGVPDYFNQQWFDFTGLGVDSVGSNWTMVIHPEDLPLCMETWQASVRTGKPFQVEFRLKEGKKEGYRWFLCRAYPVKNKKGKVIKWFGSCTDIHAQKTMMEKLEKNVEIRTHELQVINQKLAQSNKELEIKRQEIEQLAWIASHELKEPLRKLKTYLSALETHLTDCLADEKTKMYLEKVQKSTSRMNLLTNDMLIFAQLSSKDGKIEEIDLNEVIQEVLSDQKPLVTQKKAEIHYSNLPKIQGIRQQITLLFRNLINNALKFSGNSHAPVIDINCRPLKGDEAGSIEHIDQKFPHHYITVKDNGIGFDEQYAGKIFGVFQRLRQKPEYEGMGIGLSLCKKIAHNHHGEILVRSKPGEGTEMIVVLPQSIS